MSIISRVAKFTIRAILSSLAKEAASAERKVTTIVAKRDAKVAKLDKEIIAMSEREDVIVAKIREEARTKILKVLAARASRSHRKLDIHLNCGAECRALNEKAQDALTLKAKLEAVLK